jgi:HEAT repeat protein
VRTDAEITGPVVAFARTIAWPLEIDPDAGTLNDAERRHVIEGLGIVGDTWSAGILTQAFDQEDGELRVAAIEALAMCDTERVAATLERAYTSYVVAERYAAVDGAVRHGDVALLERAMRDADGSVALAAAYGLHRARRADLVDGALDGRDDARANEIRRVLPILV